MGKASGAVSLAPAWNACWEAWRFLTMDRSCHAQLLAEAAGAPAQTRRRQRSRNAGADRAASRGVVPVSAAPGSHHSRGT